MRGGGTWDLGWGLARFVKLTFQAAVGRPRLEESPSVSEDVMACFNRDLRPPDICIDPEKAKAGIDAGLKILAMTGGWTG